MNSIEWLESKLDILLPLDFEWDKLEKLFEQAKKMREQEIRDACGMALSKLLYQQAIEKK